MPKIFKCFVLSVLSINLLFALSPTLNALTNGIYGDALYVWERSGFLIGERAVYLPAAEHLAENPQIVALANDEAWSLLVHTVNNNIHKMYKEDFSVDNLTLGSALSNPAAKSLKEFFAGEYPLAEIAEAKLTPASVLGRLAVFKLDTGALKRFGEFYHFSEDNVPPEIDIDSDTLVFSPNGDGFRDEANIIYGFYDARSMVAVDVYVEVLDKISGAVVRSELLAKKLMSVTANYFWDGLANAGAVANEGWYQVRISGSDEAGNPVQDKTGEFYLKTTPPIIEKFSYTILSARPDYRNVVVKDSPKLVFTIAAQEQPLTENRVSYQIRLTKQEDKNFELSLYGTVSGSMLEVDWYLLDDYGRPVDDGFYTAECELVDDVGLVSQRISLNFEINREPIVAEIEKNDNIFTPHNTEDTYSDTAEFTITLYDRGLTVNAPYNYQILSPQGERIWQRTNYTGARISWDGREPSGRFVADGLYTLRVETIDDIGNTYEAVEKIIKTKIPVSLSAPKAALDGRNMVPIIGTVNDPGGSTFLDFEKFNIFVRAGEHADFSALADSQLWQPVTPLPYYMDSADAYFPESTYGVRSGYGAKLAFWQPTENGVYTLLLRTTDAEGYAALDVRVVTVNLSNLPFKVDRVLPADNAEFDINDDRFALITQWRTAEFENLFAYEVNVYLVSGDAKTRIIRNFSKTGNVPGEQTPIIWDGQDQWRKYVDTGAYILEIFFYDLAANAVNRQELRVSINNYYDAPLVIDRYELLNNKSLFVRVSEPASLNITAYNGGQKVYEQNFFSDGSERELTLPDWPAGFYRLNLTAVSVGNLDDYQEASLTLPLNQDLSRDGAELLLPTANIEPRHYFAFAAARTGVFYPEITGSVTLKINGLREKYPYDPYTLAITYKNSEAFWTYPEKSVGSGFNAFNGEKKDADVRFFSAMPQEVYVRTYKDSDGPVSTRWSIRDGVYGVGEEWVTYTFHGETAKDLFNNGSKLTMEMDVFFKNRQINYAQKNIYWQNITDYVQPYAGQPDYAVLQNDLSPLLDRFYLQRGTKKNIILELQSARPEYEKDKEKTYYHSWCGRRLWHYGETTVHHEFNIMQQIEYDEEEFIKTTPLNIERYSTSGSSPSDTAHGFNYVSINMLIDNFAEPQREPFEFEITVPLEKLYKSQAFYSGNLAAWAEEALGTETQVVQLPYRVSGTLRYFPLELPLSVNTTIYSAQIVSLNADLSRQLQARITHSAGYPQLLVETDYEIPWDMSMDANLKSGRLQGLVVYDPLDGEQIMLSDYYPRDGINRETSLFHIDNGAATHNPQVRLTGDWAITLQEAREVSAVHPALSVAKTYYLNGNPLGDYFTVKLDPAAYLDAYLPVRGWIAEGYKENGYSLYIRAAGDNNWTEDSFQSAYFPAEYRLKNPGYGYLLGFVKISDYNSENVLRLVVSGTKGASETLGNIVLGRKVAPGQRSRVYSADYRVWLDIYENSLAAPGVHYITLTPQRYAKDKMSLPAALADPFGPIYSMRPHGLRFQPDNKPILTSLLYNPAAEDIDLSRLVAYHLDGNNQLNIAQLYAVTDAGNDGVLQPGEVGTLSSFVESFSRQFYVPALKKLTFDTFTVYAAAADVVLTARGSPTGNLEGFLDRDYTAAVIEQSADTPSGDYQIYLPTLTEGAHQFEAREYQLVDAYKNVGPLSDIVNIIVDLTDPVLTLLRIGSTLNAVYLEYRANEKATLNMTVSDQVYAFPAAKGLNQQNIYLDDLADGDYLATIRLLDVSSRSSAPLTLAVMADHTPPTGTAILAPATGQNVPSLLNLVYAAPLDAGSGLAEFTLEYLAGDEWVRLAELDALQTAKQIYVPDNIPSFSMRLKAADRAGNTAYSPTVDIRIDNNYVYRLNEAGLQPIITGHQVIGFSLTADFAEAGTELYILDEPTDRTNLAYPVSNSVGTVINIDSAAPTVYLLGRKFGLFTNVIPLPLQLPYFSGVVYAGDNPRIDWSEPGALTYVTENNVWRVYYQPLGSSLQYLADTVVVQPEPSLALVGLETAGVLLSTTDALNYYYRPVSGSAVSLHYAVSAPVDRTLTIQNIAVPLTPLTTNYTHLVELDGVVTVAARLEKSNELALTFTPDLFCYPPSALDQIYAASQNIFSWADSQTDIVQYELRFYWQNQLVQTATTAQKQWASAALAAEQFYRVELNALDRLGNISPTESLVFYSSPGRLLSVSPFNFTQFTEKAVGISFPIHTFNEEILWAYQEYPPQVITDNVYLYQSFNLLPSKTLTANQPIDYYFDLRRLDKSGGGDLNSAALYYYRDNIWQLVPTSAYVYEPDLQRYHYTGDTFYPLALGAKRLVGWLLSGVSPNYTGASLELELNVQALKENSEIAAGPLQIKVLSANAEILADPIYTNAAGYGVLPLRLSLGRGLTYNITVADATGVTGSLSFYAENLPVTFNALVIDGWLKVTDSVTLKEGTQYWWQIDATAAPGSALTYELSDYIEMSLGAKTQFVYRPGYQDAGVRLLRIDIKDGPLSVQTRTITLNIQNTNRKPFIDNNEVITVAEKQKPPKLGALTIIDYDQDDAVQDVRLLNVPPNFNLERVPGKPIISYEISPDWPQQGTHNILAEIYDGQEWVTENIVVFVQNVNRLPEIKNAAVVNVLENQLVTYSLTVYDPDGDPLDLDFSQFPCPAGVSSSENIDAYTRKFVVWTRPGFVSQSLNLYDLGLWDTYDLKMDFQRFKIDPDTVPPTVSLARTPALATYAFNYPYYFTAQDNVWTTLNVRVYRDGELIMDTLQTTRDIVLAVPLTENRNELLFVFADGAGNAKELTRAIDLASIGQLDQNLGIYVELPIGAYALNEKILLSKAEPAKLLEANWQAGQLPYSIAEFTEMAFLSTFAAAKLSTPLDDLTLLNVPARFVLKMPITNVNQKINPVIWDNLGQSWLAHTARRLTPEEFGGLAIPTAAFNLQADEELIYFESPALGLISLMLFETTERPQIRLVNTEDYYAVGQNKILFTLQGNYLRLENTKMWLNGVTLNPALKMDKYMDNFAALSAGAVATANALLEYDSVRRLFTLTAEGFVEGNNVLRVRAENLVHAAEANFNLEVNTRRLEVREIYAYPNPAREAGEQMLRFSCILSKPADINIRIYTNQGHLVKELQYSGQIGFNAVPWDGQDRYNNQTANGMYLYVITIDDGDTKIIQKKKVGVLL
ncbi:hypothetical protein NO2_0769 [Candidatus Termititenax persephonae]|uniref:FlgD Ig-like domain-containing protein n=1 Tax=Candidatus Termititenax persephonae TaxID=2218525 RepID=A0A388TGG0_9BACT|nr:hypothetical protein NO2_0769 [Candidatus Termititenax persephonae]